MRAQLDNDLVSASFKQATGLDFCFITKAPWFHFGSVVSDVTSLFYVIGVICGQDCTFAFRLKKDHFPNTARASFPKTPDEGFYPNSFSHCYNTNIIQYTHYERLNRNPLGLMFHKIKLSGSGLDSSCPAPCRSDGP